MTAKETLKFYFGYDSFREGQETIISSIMAGRDALAIMPTGAGKSICYQVPALMLPGITLVISPLISLMQDQVKALNEAGIHAAFINSSLTEAQIGKALNRAAEGIYKIIYVAPERLETYGFTDFASRADVSMVTVDEAHCISQWGQDFRQSYLKIVDFIKNLPKRPIVSAFTATATEEVKEDILCILHLVNPNVTVTGFDRENLYYSVENIRRKDAFVMEYIEKHQTDSGIIYCATRKNVDKLYETLRNRSVPVTRYHAGLDNDTRKKNQEDFIYDRVPVIVATNAFGMGIDKSNVRFVIHYNMPQSMENYYQEAGRAGRDGEPSQCILLFSAQDIIINKFLLEKKDFSGLEPEDAELIRQRDLRRLQIMEGYCRTTWCLRNYILNYFGEKASLPCDNCGNCHRDYKETDMTAQAKQIINCVAETRGRYGLTIVTGTLLGADRARLRELGTIHYKSYGALKDCNEALIRGLISQLVEEGYLYQTEDQYSVLKMGNIAPLKEEGTRVVMRLYEEKEPDRRKSARPRSTDSLTAAGYDLFEELRGLRLEIAREESLPPYIIFNDKTLIDMCVKLPKTAEGLLTVSGVGENKLAKYGDRFLKAISSFVESHPGAVLSMETAAADRDGGAEMAAAADKPERTRSRSGRKADFYLAEGDAEQFVYQDLYYISDIKNELNRICTAEDVRKATLGIIWDYLVSQELTYEDGTNGIFVKKPTAKGLEYGILLEDKVAASGVPYQLIKYPPKVQKMIVDYLVGPRAEEDNRNFDEPPTVQSSASSAAPSTAPSASLSAAPSAAPTAALSASMSAVSSAALSAAPEESGSLNKRVAYNRSVNRPDGAGAAWSPEEDARLDEEYQSGMKLSEIARLHNRTRGGIRARLKKHGLIE